MVSHRAGRRINRPLGLLFRNRKIAIATRTEMIVTDVEEYFQMGRDLMEARIFVPKNELEPAPEGANSTSKAGALPI